MNRQPQTVYFQNFLMYIEFWCCMFWIIFGFYIHVKGCQLVNLHVSDPPQHNTSCIGSFFLQAAVYKICKEMYCEGMEEVPFSDDDPDLIGDR